MKEIKKTRVARVAKGVTREQMAKDLNISKATLAKAENGTWNSIAFGTLKDIAEYLNVDFEELFLKD